MAQTQSSQLAGKTCCTLVQKGLSEIDADLKRAEEEIIRLLREVTA
jgi:hypothetical protein